MQRIAKIAGALWMMTLCAHAQTALQHYEDKANGVTFDYAGVWHPLDAGKDTDYLRPSIQPVLFAVVYGKEDAPYPGTDFSSLAFNYAIAPAKNPAACKAAITATAMPRRLLPSPSMAVRLQLQRAATRR